MSSSASGGSFEALGVVPQLVEALRRMKLETPTRPQRETIPAGLEGRDLAAVAPTGTGKTLAYLIPVAQMLLRDPPPRKRGRPIDPRRRLRALVLCPTRELAQQVAEEARLLLRGSVLRTGAVYGKSALPPQRAMVRAGVDLLVGTPGRVRELCEEDSLTLAFIRQVVIDEADRMFDMGFLPQVRDLLSRAPAGRQLLCFTATMPPAVEGLVQELLRDPVRVDVSHGAPARVVGTPKPRQDAGHAVIDVRDDDKTALTVALVKGEQRKGVIVFCRTRRRAGWVAQALRRHEVRTALVHGDRSQRQRQAALDSFMQEHAQVLVATDVAARGLHIPAVRTVINYDVPLMPEDYVHRAGRAGHGGGFAETITLRSPADVERWRRVERAARIKPYMMDPPSFAKYQRQESGRAPDTEPAPQPRKPSARQQRKARIEAAATPSLAALIRRGPRRSRGKGAKGSPGAKSKSRQGRQNRRPLGKGQKPGRGVRRATNQ